MLSRVENYEMWESIYNWIVFLGELALIVLGCVMLYFICRYLRTVNKRVKAVKKLKKSAARAGFKCSKTNTYLNFDCHNMETCFVLTKGLVQYNVRFLTTFKKNRTLRFLAPDAYVSEKEFGYKIFKSEKELDDAISKLYLKKLLPLIGKGLSACIYTQLSDVEEEINGLITFDRAKVKVDRELMKRLHDAIYTEAEKFK